MFESAWTNLERGLQSVEAYARTGDALRRLVHAHQGTAEPSIAEFDLGQIARGAPNQNEWRISVHSAVVGRLYAVYEQFIEELLASWIKFRTNAVKYSDIPPDLVKNYENGFVYILPLAGDGRYDHLSRETMISEQAKAYAGGIDFRIFSECFTYHAKNFRLETLLEVAARCGIDDLKVWLQRNPQMVEFFGGRLNSDQQIEKRLKDFVQYRNDAAHASIDITQILGLDAFIEFVSFIRALCRAVYEKVQAKALDHLQSLGAARDIGKVSWLHSGKTICVGNVEGVTLSVGSVLYARSAASCGARTIKSLKMDDDPRERVVIAKPTEVGISFDSKVSLNDTLLVVDTVFAPT